MRLCRNNGSQLLFWETGGKGVSYGSLDLWQDPGHLSLMWAAELPSIKAAQASWSLLSPSYPGTVN